MGATTAKRKAELQLRFGDNAFTPISADYIEQARELSARYILFVNKDNKHGYCEHCCNDVEFTKTKHKEKMICPNCGKELTVQHTWRKARCDWNVDWFVKGEVVDDETFALRYIEVSQKADYTKEISEKAREIYDFKHGWSYQFSNLQTGWTVNSRYYFTEFTMNWHRRYECCIAAKALNNIASELKGITTLKYFDQLNEYFGIYVYARDSIRQLMNASLYEKLEKVGLGEIAKDDYKRYNGERIKYKRSETSLIKMLGIDKLRYNILLSNGTYESLGFIRENKGLSIKMLDYVVSNKVIKEFKALKEIDMSESRFMKTLKYLKKNNINVYEYKHYIDLLEKLKYKLDESYLFPKDFAKEDMRVSDEYLKMTDKKAYREKLKKDGLIKQISDGLRKMPDLQEFMNGTNGLLVYVPESDEDLKREGKALHCCLGTYTDRVAYGKTLVFFVRKLNDPTAPFVAFEYHNGNVVQCRYDHNEPVKDDNIISFVDAFSKMLKKNKVLCA